MRTLPAWTQENLLRVLQVSSHVRDTSSCSATFLSFGEVNCKDLSPWACRKQSITLSANWWEHYCLSKNSLLIFLMHCSCHLTSSYPFAAAHSKTTMVLYSLQPTKASPIAHNTTVSMALVLVTCERCRKEHIFCQNWYIATGSPLLDERTHKREFGAHQNSCPGIVNWVHLWSQCHLWCQFHSCREQEGDSK